MSFLFNATVIIVTFNRKNILADTLNHLNQQEGAYGTSFEVIVVDDGSTDGTQEYIQEEIATKKYHYHLSYFNTGLTNVYGVCIARNMGIKNARGKYLLFLDDDCIPHKNWVHAHVTMLEVGEEVLVGYISHKRKQLEEEIPITIDNPVMQRLKQQSQNNNLAELLSGNLALSRKCIERAGMFDERFAQYNAYGYDDIEFGHRIIIGGFTLRFNQNAIVYTRVKDSSITKERKDMIHKSKMVWMHIVMHPQEGLPITPLLYQYANCKKEEFKALGYQLP